MSATGATLSTIEKVLKRNYAPSLKSLVNNQHPFLNAINTKVGSFRAGGENYYTYFPLVIAENERVGARSEASSIIPGGKRTTIQGYVDMKYFYGKMQVTGQAIEVAKKDKYAFAQTLNAEKDSLATAMRMDIYRQLFNDGTGILCMVNGAVSTADNEITVDGPGNQFLRRGMRIISAPNTDGSSAAAGSDLSYGLSETNCYYINKNANRNNNTTTLYLSASDTVADNRYIFRYGNAGNEMNGIGNIIASYADRASSSLRGDGEGVETVCGINKTTYPEFEANLFHNSGTNRALTKTLLDQSMAAGDFNQGGKCDMILTTMAIERKYAQLCDDDRIATNTMALDGGYKALAYKGIPFIGDRYAFPNKIYFLDTSTFTMYKGCEDGWIDVGGGVLQRDGTYEDTYNATWRQYQNLGCDAPGKSTILADIAES